MRLESDGPERLPPFLPTVPSLSAYELWQCHKTRRGFREAYSDHWEDSVSRTGTGRPVDAIIAPVAPTAAPLHGEYRYVSIVYNAKQNISHHTRSNITYGAVWSTLDYPSLAFPVTTVDPALDVNVPRDTFLSKDDQLLHEICELEQSTIWTLPDMV
jgi:amidase